MDSEWLNFYQLSLSEKYGLWKKHIKNLGVKRYVQMFIFQRIFRINSDVPWPVHWSTVIHKPKNIRLKNWPDFRTYLGKSNGCYIQADCGIEIGINVRFGSGVKIISSNHDTNDFDKHVPSLPIKIGDNVWLGANSIILPGVELGNHTIVAAGAVVNRSFIYSGRGSSKNMQKNTGLQGGIMNYR